MIIQHNMLAMNNLMVGKQLQKAKIKNMERLSSGYRINRAADDAANMAISEKMTSRIRALARCQQNIEEGISLAQTADGALNEVNNMLNRVNELCVQAANGINTAEDRSKIAEEITLIYDEMDRIFETTEFNTMKIFRHDGDNYYGPEAEYLYHESVTSTPGELHNWGAAMFPTKQFDLAKPATAATATLTLPSGVSASDSSAILNDTSFYIEYKGTTYTILFGDGAKSVPSNTLYINTKSTAYDTVSEAMGSLTSYYSFIDKTSVNGNKVTFSFDMPTEERYITFKADTDQDGKRETITATEILENGSKNNGISIYSPKAALDPIGTPDSKIQYSTTASVTITPLAYLDSSSTGFPTGYNDWPSFLATISFNELKLFGSSDTDYISLAPLAQKNIQSADDFRRELTSLINAQDGYSASYDGTKNIIITKEELLAESAMFGYIDEVAGRTGQDLELPTIPVSISVQSSTPSSESKTTQTFTMPELKSDQIYTFKINNNHYILYDANTYPNYSVTDSDSSKYYSVYNAKNYGGMEQAFLSILRGNYSGYTVTSENGIVTMTSKELNDNTSIQIGGSDPNVLALLTPKSSEVLGIGSPYYTREYSLSLDFSSFEDSGFDPSTLYNKGFMLNNTYYQFTDGNTPTNNSKIKPIELVSISTLEDLGNAISNATGLYFSCDGTNKIILSSVTKTNSSSNSYINFSDGSPQPTFTNSAVSSGGTAYKNPQAEINFSAYDMDNLDDLYGTGFRLTCATCPGEFVNVMFCHDKSELNYPDSFEYTDENGNTNTIHNYMVELKDVTDGSQIASYIAEQLERDLDHFTEVKVSDTNPAVLIAQDKRSKDQTGRGQVLAGVYTNFLYNVVPEKLPNLGDKVGGGRKDTEAYYAYCMIYAGDTKDKPYIPVHLPHFSVENLKLEYPGEPWDTYEKITDVMNRSKNAAEVVSMARSKIGADQNRLEHAFDYAANAEEQITDAMSRIKDTDMAEAVTTQAKLTILSNTQEAMLSQIADLPERILPLLQQ